MEGRRGKERVKEEGKAMLLFLHSFPALSSSFKCFYEGQETAEMKCSLSK